MKNNLITLYFKKLPKAFCFSIILFLISQGLLISSQSFWHKALLYSQPIFDSLFRFEAQLKFLPDNKIENARIFLFGSSIANEAFDVDYLNSKLSPKRIKFYKLAFPLCYPYDMFQVQKKLIDKNPDLIVILADPSFFYTPYSFSVFGLGDYHYNVLWPYVFDFSIIPYLVKHQGIRELIKERNVLISSLVNRMFFILRHRGTLRHLIEAYIRDIITGKKGKFYEYYIYSDWLQSTFEQALKYYSNKKLYEETKLTDFNKEMFDIFVKSILQNKIKIIIIDSPHHPLMKRAYDNKFDILYSAFLSSQFKKFNFIYLTQDKLPMFEATDFADFEHLNKIGREKMSEFLQSYIDSNFGIIFQDKS